MIGRRMPGSAPPLCVGIDTGRTKTLLRATYPGAPDPIALSGPGLNVQHAGIDPAAETLTLLLETLYNQLPAPCARAVVCAGVAGGGLAADRDALARRWHTLLTQRLPATRWTIDLVDDGTIALEAALGRQSGLVLIAGSGSLVLGRTQDGVLTRNGGWGSLLGDEGSGYALGLDAVRAVARAIDGGPATRLQALLQDRFGLKDRADIIQRVYQQHWPLQAAAPLVMEAAALGDAVAQAILHTQTDALAAQAARLTAQHSYASRLYLTGGLVNAALYRKTLTQSLRTRLPEWTVHRASQAPVDGALALATARTVA